MARVDAYLALLDGAEPFLRDFLVDLAIQDRGVSDLDMDRIRQAAWPQMCLYEPPADPRENWPDSTAFC